MEPIVRDPGCDVHGHANRQEMLRRVFRYNAFRGRSKEIVGNVIAGGSALVLMPTGGGKSLCYQVPALCLPGWRWFDSHRLIALDARPGRSPAPGRGCGPRRCIRR